MSLEIIEDDRSQRRVGRSMLRGSRLKCPNCGIGQLFRGYLKSVDACGNCGEELHHHRADDAPPYFTILIVGHIIVPAMLVVEKLYKPDLWLHAVIWLPLTILLSLMFLPVTKGALIGLQWALRMHGFDPDHDETNSGI